MAARSLITATLLLAATVHADPVVWRLSTGQGGEVLMLGSVHYLREEDYPLPAVIEDIYGRVDALVMEMDLDDLDPTTVSTQFMQAAMLPTGTPLRAVLDGDVYAQAESTARGFGLEFAAFDAFEPWLVALTFMDLGMIQRGFRADQGLEQHLLRRAARDGKEVLGLETLADQIGVFDHLTMTEQQALLAQTLEEIRSPEQDMDELLVAWRTGSLDQLTDKLMASFDEFPRLYQTLVINRNRRWVTELERLAARPRRYLVVVGALHLVGDQNVIDLLRARGMTVEPFQTH